MHFERPTFKTIGIGRTFHKTIFLGLLGTFLVNDQLLANNYYVDTAAQFNAHVDNGNRSFATLYAGDRVYMKGGNWDGLTNTITGTMTDADAQTNPAIIYSCDGNYVPTIGGVTVTNLSSITLAGQGITIAGLTFSPTSGMYAPDTNSDYAGNSADILSTDYNSRYITISHIKFDYCGRDNTLQPPLRSVDLRCRRLPSHNPVLRVPRKGLQYQRYQADQSLFENLDS